MPSETSPDETQPRFVGWITIAVLVGMSILGLGAGVAVAFYGGIPHAYDRYGVVAVPGRQVIELPAGRVMLDHADDVDGCWDNTSHVKNASIYSAPDGMTVTVTPVSGSESLRVTRIPAWLYVSQVNCRGHEPFGRIDVPRAGRYLVEATDSEHRNDPSIQAALASSSGLGAGVAFGPKPWAPFGSPWLAGAAVAVVILGLAWIPGRIWTSWMADRRPGH